MTSEPGRSGVLPAKNCAVAGQPGTSTSWSLMARVILGRIRSPTRRGSSNNNNHHHCPVSLDLVRQHVADLRWARSADTPSSCCLPESGP